MSIRMLIIDEDLVLGLPRSPTELGSLRQGTFQLEGISGFG